MKRTGPFGARRQTSARRSGGMGLLPAYYSTRVLLYVPYHRNKQHNITYDTLARRGNLEQSFNNAASRPAHPRTHAHIVFVYAPRQLTRAPRARAAPRTRRLSLSLRPSRQAH